ncbi:MAG: tetratricopeptide repeat protein [Candidatus Sulfotelmatobacter sp.]
MIHVLLLLWLAGQAAAPSDAIAHLQAGIAADKQHHVEVAITEFRKATDLDANLVEGFVGLGQAYLENREYGSAVAPLKHALRLNPDLIPAHQLLGYALLIQGYSAEAIPHLERAQENAALGIAEIDAGQLKEAVTHLQAALEQRPNDPDLLYYLGRASGLLSKQSVDTLLTIDPDSARAHQTMAENYFALRQMPQAEREFLAAIKLRPDTPEVHLELGNVYAKSSQWDKAEAEFRTQAKMQPGNAEAAYRLGSALLQEGNAHEAREELIRADHLRPDMPEVLYSLGKAALLESDQAAAEKSWLKLLSIEKESDLAAQTHYALAGLYRRQGKKPEAEHEMQEFKKLQNINPGQPAEGQQQ